MRVLYSPRLMLASLLLNAGCMLRVSSEILSYENYWPAAWRVLPWSAVCELLAVTIFLQPTCCSRSSSPPAHLHAA